MMDLPKVENEGKNGSYANCIELRGTLKDEFTFNHENSSGRFWKSFVYVKRKSGTVDEVPVIIHEKILPKTEVKGKKILIRGSYHSRIYHGHLILYAFGDSIQILDNNEQNLNLLFLRGKIWKMSHIRTTPFGRRILDFVLVVKRKNGREDFFPCIAWENTAFALYKMKVMDEISVTARVQSRTYFKNYAEAIGEFKIAYEVSVSKFN